jgi:hypothetical protein
MLASPIRFPSGSVDALDAAISGGSATAAGDLPVLHLLLRAVTSPAA